LAPRPPPPRPRRARNAPDPPVPVLTTARATHQGRRAAVTSTATQRKHRSWCPQRTEGSAYYWSRPNVGRKMAMSEAAPKPGQHMHDEIVEQPEIFADLLAHRADIAEVAERVRQHRPRFVLLAARGSSDHAAMYAKYLVEVFLQLPVGLVSPSTTTLYGAQPDLTDVLLISVSQSGGSPDLLEVTEASRRQGALTLAVTNTTDSPLNQAAELAVNVRAGA